jgi:cell shape-determining protein MreD
MNWFNTIAILLLAYLAVFFQATFNELRHFAGVQVDLLPGLVVYTAISSGIVTLTLVTVCAGLWFDSLTANPLGLSTLPLFLIGLFIQRNRDAILRDQPYAQMLLASALVPLFCVLILLNTGTRPLIGWFSLWQWFVMSVIGAVATPIWFWISDFFGRILNYRPIAEAGFRADREIKRRRGR